MTAMNPIYLIVFTFLSIFGCVTAQEATVTIDSSTMPALPYHEIHAAPETITPGSVLSRTIDGLGYRYYWATKDLRPDDIAWLPGNNGRSAKQTLDHLYGLSLMILNTAIQEPNVRPLNMPDVGFEELRKMTLHNIKNASDAFRAADDLSNHKIIFQRGENQSEVPLWNLMNGPLADAIYHVGQIVSYRRSAGNPMHPGVSVFSGKTAE